ncbi:MAG: DUF4173 domain-containing protein [Phycisphaerae bacterium]|nr:DUF4173 domain-containing protein [Phycisphaerae bacterium]
MFILIVTLGCLFVSILCNLLFWGRTFGVSMPLFMVIVAAFVLWLKRKDLCRSKFTLTVLLLFLAYLSACVVCYRNILILYATVPTIMFGLAAMLFVGREGFSFVNCIGVVESILKSAIGAVIILPETFYKTFKKVLRIEGDSGAFRKVILGVLVSIPFLILFSCLFTSADPVFEGQLKDFLAMVWKAELWLRGVTVILLWNLLCGYLRRGGKVHSLQSRVDRIEPKRSFEGIVVFVFLLLNNILFFVFILIQLEYLFGGEAVVRNTDYTYADYVHKGFYEFWATVILVSLIIICTGRRLKEQKGIVRSMVELLWIAMIGQTFVMIASGFKRILAYEDAYGYSYFRILVGLFLLFMAGVFALFIFKIILRKSLAWLISCGICLAFVFLIFVSTFSIDKFIAEKNVARWLDQKKDLDIEYLGNLSTDAYSQIERIAIESDSKTIRKQAREILKKMSDDAEIQLQHWVSWNLSMSKAKQSSNQNPDSSNQDPNY